MKHPNPHTVSCLEALPNVGKATAGDFHTIGIDRLQDNYHLDIHTPFGI